MNQSGRNAIGELISSAPAASSSFWMVNWCTISCVETSMNREWSPKYGTVILRSSGEVTPRTDSVTAKTFWVWNSR